MESPQNKLASRAGPLAWPLMHRKDMRPTQSRPAQLAGATRASDHGLPSAY